jgi:HrpA-like RNA helicase
MRLDVELQKFFTQGECSNLEELYASLLSHREAMKDIAERLLVQRELVVQRIETQLSVEKKKKTSSIDEVVKKANTIDVVSASLKEAKRHILEFRSSYEKFLQSDVNSVVAARLFSREVYNRFKTCLPIYSERTTILDSVRDDFAVLILSAETGSGKSTQVVQYLAESGLSGKVLCTQPRRVAAASLADRVAVEMMTQKPSKDHPNLVAHKTHGGANTTQTQILFMTDSSLLSKLYYSETLPEVSAVVVDEVHERSVNTDLLIALLRRTLHLRAKEGKKPFKLVLTSATMNEALFADYFSRCKWDINSPRDESRAPVLKVGGRTYPVDIYYEEEGSKRE